MRLARSLGALLALSAGVYALGVRPRMLRSGASDEELWQPYPGGDVIPGGQRGATMAVTIDAPPSRLWPWLVQMGCDRAGWYSWDRLDNGGVPSAERIHPEWQELAIGDRLASTPSGRAWFEVAALEPERFLGLRASIDLRGGRPFDTAGPRPRWYVDALWGFQLKELPEGRTRLVVSGYASARPRLLQVIADLLFWQPAHWGHAEAAVREPQAARRARWVSEQRQAGSIPAFRMIGIASRPVRNLIRHVLDVGRQRPEVEREEALRVPHGVAGFPPGEGLEERLGEQHHERLVVDDHAWDVVVAELRIEDLSAMVSAPRWTRRSLRFGCPQLSSDSFNRPRASSHWPAM